MVGNTATNDCILKLTIELCYFLIAREQAEKLKWSISLIKALDNG